MHLVASPVSVTKDTLGMASHVMVREVYNNSFYYTLMPLDIDECATSVDTCDTNANCTNIGGSFTCACNPGYSGDGFTCTGECAVCGYSAEPELMSFLCLQ